MKPRTRRASVRFWALPLLLVTAAAPRLAARNAASMAELQAHPWFATIHQDLLEIITSQDRIAYPSTRGDVVHNFWTDAQHERAIEGDQRRSRGAA